MSDLEAIFPNLRNTPYERTSPETLSYNCIAWVAGRVDRCWWPSLWPRYFWPSGILDSSLEGFVRVFQELGYESCENRDREPGYEKVAIYAQGSLPSHMARQLPSGQWTSKCGDLEDITHNTLEGLEGSDYGFVVQIMRRRQVP